MTVQPGKGGQTIIEDTITKITYLRNAINEFNNDIDIEADGGIKDTNAELVRNAGANILIAGTYIVKNPNLTEAVRKIRGQ